MINIEPERITMTTRELDIYLDSLKSAFMKDIKARINTELIKVINHKAGSIYCESCNLNVLYQSEPTVFGAKTNKPSAVYHGKCWRELT